MLTKSFIFALFLSLLTAAVSEPEYDNVDGEQQRLQQEAPDPRTSCRSKSHSVPNRSPNPDPIAPDRFQVRFNTTVPNSEPIVLEVFREWSPLGVDRFYQLILDDFFTCCAFFRVVSDFVVQFGIAAEPQETAKWRNSAFADDPVLQSNTESYVSFATAGPDTRTTQLFINTNNNDRLDQMGFSPFARVMQGMDTTKRIVNPIPEDEDNGINQAMYEEGGNEWLLNAYPTADLILSTEILESSDSMGPTAAEATTTHESKFLLAGAMILEVLAFMWLRKKWF